MQNDDIVRIKDLFAVRASVLRARRRVLVTAFVTPLLCVLLILLLLYRFTSLGTTASLVLTSVFILGGVAVFAHWQRHYQSILQQLDALDRKVSGGEIVYASQVAFHSYR
ncbi:hypothetical protein B0E46_16975 [Rhodanobacter sp. B04]|uniref:hypothetical protein n=1 Tax=Rhodanobacter sp. B04 TaxID=1945860 RepID=UPI0009856F73|nr:hypothetical protein [Rhodanobacter sp. B04]OOG61640.1 hypothetical protein B0E46_16975 [Rhodanobacter sp. B04]